MEKTTYEHEAEETSQHIKIIMCTPCKKALVTTVPNCLESLQRLVGGYIKAIYPFDDPIAIICNKEGKLKGMALNRALHDEAGQIQDILAGPFFITGLSDNSFTSLSPELQDKYFHMFELPELFFWNGNQIQCIQIDASY